METTGWIKLHRKIRISPVWDGATPSQKLTAISCLLMANRDSKTIHVGGERIELQPGEFWTSQEALMKETGLNRQQIRGAIHVLSKLDFLTITTTKRGTLIKIVNWKSYQASVNDSNQDDNLSATKRQPSDNHEQEVKKLESSNILLDKTNNNLPSPPRKARGSVKSKDTKPKQNVWGIWVDANRELGRVDPVRVGPDLGASKQLQSIGMTDDQLKEIMRHYLLDADNYISGQGHPLRLLAARINKYQQYEPAPPCRDASSVGDMIGDLFGGKR